MEFAEQIIEQRLNENDCSTGYILDGFPRTEPQTIGLDKLLNSLNQKLDCVLVMNIDDSMIINRLSNRRSCKNCNQVFNLLYDPPKKDDICYATTNRQAAVKKIAKECDNMFVIGSRNSSNSVRLVEVAKNNGCEYAELIHSESTFPLEKISKCKTIGISSGASAPEVLVNEFIENIKRKFTVEIEEVEIVKEDVTFKIPGKLN